MCVAAMGWYDWTVVLPLEVCNRINIYMWIDITIHWTIRSLHECIMESWGRRGLLERGCCWLITTDLLVGSWHSLNWLSEHLYYNFALPFPVFTNYVNEIFLI